MTDQKDTDRKLIARLLGPSESEVSCEHCFEELDRCVELELAGIDYNARVPGMRSHLQGCAACAEEFATVRALVASEQADGDPR